jgi:hypothetical protein
MDVVQGAFLFFFQPYMFYFTFRISTYVRLGATIGSVQLDTAFENTVRQRLLLANQIMPTGFHPQEMDDIAWKMAKGREYQNAKCEYGSVDDETEYFTVAIPGLRPDYMNMNAGVSNGEMMFRR